MSCVALPMKGPAGTLQVAHLLEEKKKKLSSSSGTAGGETAGGETAGGDEENNGILQYGDDPLTSSLGCINGISFEDAYNRCKGAGE